MASNHLSWTKHNTALRIIFSKLYMESGFYLIDPALGAAIGSSANVYYSAAAQSILTTDGDYPDQGSVTINRNATEPNHILKGQILESGFRSKSMLLTDLIDSDTWKARRSCINRCAPSQYTGKLRMLVQALYGAKRFDYSRMGDMIPGVILNSIMWAGEVLNPIMELGDFSFLVTTEDFDYFLCQISPTRLKFIELVFSKQAELLKQTLKLLPKHTPTSGSSDYATRIEAYILSTAKITDKSRRYTCDIASSEGLPLYYGWHSDWDGLKCHIVKHEKVINFAASPKPTYKIVARQCELNISYTKDIEGVYTFSAAETLVTEANWTPAFHWLHPACPFIGSGHLLDLDYGRFSSPPSEMTAEVFSFTDVPLYCYIDNEGELQVIKISSSLVEKAGEVAIPTNIYPCGGDEAFDLTKGTYIGTFPQGSVSVQVADQYASHEFEGLETGEEITWKPVLTTPFFNPSINNPWSSYPVCGGGATVGDITTSMGFTNANWQTGGKPTGVLINPTCESPPVPETYVVGFARTDWSPSVKQYTSQIARYGFIAVVIPWDDCEAVVLVSDKFKNEEQYYEYNADFSLSLFGYAGGKIFVGKTYLDPCIGNQFAPVYDIQDINLSTANLTGFDARAKLGDGNLVQVPETIDSSCIVVGGFGDLPKITRSGRSSYFWANFNDPVIYSTDYVRHTLLGSVKVDLGYPTYNMVVDWPAIGDTQVGWV